MLDRSSKPMNLTYLWICTDIVKRVDTVHNNCDVETRLEREFQDVKAEFGILGISVWFKQQWENTPMPNLNRIMRRFNPFLRARREMSQGLRHETLHDVGLWEPCVTAGRLLRIYEKHRHEVKLVWMEKSPLLWISYDEPTITNNRFLDVLLSRFQTLVRECLRPPSAMSCVVHEGRRENV